MPHDPMASFLPFDAPSPLEYFATLVAEDPGFPLLEAAVSVAQDEYPDLDVLSVLEEVDGFGERLRRRVPADASPMQRLHLLRHGFFEELGFGGNVNDYYAASNSYLPDVLRTRRGLPITLALLLVELAGQVGLKAAGVSFPGHFLVRIALPRGEVVIDPFTGESLSRDELVDRLQPHLRPRGLAGEAQALLGAYLQAAPAREVMARLLRNLKALHASSGDWRRLLAVQERLVILLPDDWSERRDRGLALAELGRREQAEPDLAAYVLHRPDADDAHALRLRLASWRSGRPHLH